MTWTPTCAGAMRGPWPSYPACARCLPLCLLLPAACVVIAAADRRMAWGMWANGCGRREADWQRDPPSRRDRGRGAPGEDGCLVPRPDLPCYRVFSVVRGAGGWAAHAWGGVSGGREAEGRDGRAAGGICTCWVRRRGLVDLFAAHLALGGGGDGGVFCSPSQDAPSLVLGGRRVPGQ